MHEAIRLVCTSNRCPLHLPPTCTARAHCPSTYQQVLWLDVSVDDVEAVEVPEGLGQVVDHAAGVPLRVLSG